MCNMSKKVCTKNLLFLIVNQKLWWLIWTTGKNSGKRNRMVYGTAM